MSRISEPQSFSVRIPANLLEQTRWGLRILEVALRASVSLSPMDAAPRRRVVGATARKAGRPRYVVPEDLLERIREGTMRLGDAAEEARVSEGTMRSALKRQGVSVASKRKFPVRLDVERHSRIIASYCKRGASVLSVGRQYGLTPQRISKILQRSAPEVLPTFEESREAAAKRLAASLLDRRERASRIVASYCKRDAVHAELCLRYGRTPASLKKLLSQHRLSMPDPRADRRAHLVASYCRKGATYRSVRARHGCDSPAISRALQWLAPHLRLGPGMKWQTLARRASSCENSTRKNS